ncbi:hypothetical protein A9Q76_02180 [Arcobacter sp. 31_11_sub10_T18]|nr:hypothetical protein A9Q76_02180 [Arcobacter sp. 31_11_sub10_T18]
MGLKKYVIFSILLIVLVAGYIFSLELGSYEIIISDISLQLPVFVWILLPTLLLLVASILHMFFYGFKGYLGNRAIVKDEENILESIKNNLLYKNDIKLYKRQAFRDVSEILSQVNLVPKDGNFNSSNTEINAIVEKVKSIHAGTYLTPKELKLDEANPLMVINNNNRVNTDADYCLEILKRPANHKSEIIKKAYFTVLAHKSMTTVKKVLANIKLDKEMILELFKRDSEQTDFSLSKEEVIKYIKNVDFSRQDFIYLAKLYKNNMLPDDLLKIFEEISNNNDLALDSYLYVLFEYEMLDNIRDIFGSTAQDELLPYKALLDLKDSGKQYTLDSLCYIK